MTNEVITPVEVIKTFKKKGLRLYTKTTVTGDDGKDTVKFEITQLGQDLLDIERCLAEMNSVHWAELGSTFIKGAELLNDYSLPAPYMERLKPSIVTWFGEDVQSSELVTVDLMDETLSTEVQDEYGNVGHLLSSAQLKQALKNLYKAINPKVSQVGSLTTVTRKALILNREVVRTYPTKVGDETVVIDGNKYCFGFRMNNPGVYSNRAYGRALSDEDVSDFVSNWVERVYRDASTENSTLRFKQEEV